MYSAECAEALSL